MYCFILETEISNYIKSYDLYNLKKTIRKNKGMFNTYFCLKNVHKPSDYTDNIKRLRHTDFISDLFTLHREDELQFIDFLRFLNKHIVKDNEQVRNSCKNIILALITRYLRSYDVEYLYCINSLFVYFKAYDKSLITHVFHSILVNENDNVSLTTLFIDNLNSTILDIFLPYINIHQYIDTSIYTPSLKLLQIIGIDIDEYKISNISLISLLLQSKSVGELKFIKQQGYDLENEYEDVNVSHECIVNYISTNDPLYSTFINKTDKKLIHRLYPCFDDELINVIIHESQIDNLKMIHDYTPFLNNCINPTDDECRSLKTAFSKMDFNIRLAYNVSPFLLCNCIKVASIMEKFKVNTDNFNGLFYIFLRQEESLFLYMLKQGVDAIPSINRLKRDLKKDLNKNLRHRLLKTNNLLCRCHKQYKQFLIKLLDKKRDLCTDVCKLIVNDYF